MQRTMKSGLHSKSRRIRCLFLSDLHLGFRHSRVNELLQLLRKLEPENIYLVGDFIDGWYLKKRWYWQPECSLILLRLLELAGNGTRIRLAIGNHDDFLRDPLMQQILIQSGIREVAEEFHHELPDGRRFLVLHGDQFDPYERLPSLISGLLCVVYEGMLWLNHCWSRLTATSSHGRDTLIAGMKCRTRSVTRHVAAFQNLLMQHARVRGCQGVICGHIHAPKTIQMDGVTYCNSGDWVENCTALIEDHEGRLELLWLDDPCR